jgi:ABC-type transport system substrate-binding protein
LNPFLADTIAIGTVTRNIFEGLTRYNPVSGEVEPALAESWTVSDDKLTYTFTLRQGVLFHQVAGVEYAEGEREVTAGDILWNYMTSLNGDEAISIHSGELDMIAGAAEYTASTSPVAEATAEPGAEATEAVAVTDVSGLKVIDDYTFEITLNVPDRLFLINGMVPIVSPAANEQLGEDINNVPVGTGPFQFVEWLRQDRLVLEANSDYWNEGYPKVDGIRFINYGDDNTALLDYRAGQLDFLFSFPSGQRGAIIEEFADQYNEKPGLHLRYFGFKMSTGFMAENPLVRQAFNYALNRDLIWTTLEEGARFPANLGMLVPAMPASTPATIYTYDPVKADQLLDEAGFPNEDQSNPASPRPGFPEIDLYVLSTLAEEKSIPVWQEDLRQLGVTLNVVVEEGATYWDHIVEDDVVLFINGWAAGLIDPADVLNFLILDGRGSMEYDNPEVNELLRAAMVEYDEAARTELYQKAHDIIMADSVVVPSAYSKVTWLQKPWIENFVPGGGGTYTAPLWDVTVNPDNM